MVLNIEHFDRVKSIITLGKNKAKNILFDYRKIFRQTEEGGDLFSSKSSEQWGSLGKNQVRHANYLLELCNKWIWAGFGTKLYGGGTKRQNKLDGCCYDISKTIFWAYSVGRATNVTRFQVRSKKIQTWKSRKSCAKADFFYVSSHSSAY